MSALHASVLNAFKHMGWAYRKVDDPEVIEADFEAHHTKVSLHVQSFGTAGIMSVVAGASFPVPATHFTCTAELLMRVNKTLNVGNFELDWDNGQVLFRATNVFPPNRADERIISGLVHSAVAEVDRITPFLGEVCRTPKGELLIHYNPAESSAIHLIERVSAAGIEIADLTTQEADLEDVFLQLTSSH